jgi:hypothetical protein
MAWSGISLIQQLKLLLDSNAVGLLPCDSLNIMPFETFGTMWQRIAQDTASQYIKDRIDSIRNVAPNWVVDNFNIQSLTDANGAIVNCDYFPVRIMSLPPGMTQKQLVEYFRVNINTFIDSSLGVKFKPYKDLSFHDSVRYFSHYDTSLGALISITMVDDGSVILSNYYMDSVSKKYRFTFTTMETPLDHDHPVSGNREFGVYADPSRPGEFVFYTMGVDRTSDWMYSLLNWSTNAVFDGADKLWKSIQKNMVKYITDNGGQAGYYTPSTIIARPKWEDVKEFLKGEIDFATLKQRLGC